MSERQYLINKTKEGWCASVAHIWTGDDTACTMWSTGGLKTYKYQVYQSKPEDCRVCETCEKAIEYPEAKNPHIRVSHKRIILRALGTIISLLCEMKYGWPHGIETEESRKKFLNVINEESWVPKLEKPPPPENGREVYEGVMGTPRYDHGEEE